MKSCIIICILFTVLVWAKLAICHSSLKHVHCFVMHLFMTYISEMQNFEWNKLHIFRSKWSFVLAVPRSWTYLIYDSLVLNPQCCWRLMHDSPTWSPDHYLSAVHQVACNSTMNVKYPTQRTQLFQSNKGCVYIECKEVLMDRASWFQLVAF